MTASRRFWVAPWSSAIPGPAGATPDTAGGIASMSSTTITLSTPCGASRFAEGEPAVRGALWSSIYRDSLFPRTEYAEAWKVLQRDLPRRDACRRMVDLLFIAHEQACEAELAHLLAADLDAGRVPEPTALALLLAPKATALPRDVAVAHPSLDSFDALLGASA